MISDGNVHQQSDFLRNFEVNEDKIPAISHYEQGHALSHFDDMNVQANLMSRLNERDDIDEYDHGGDHIGFVPDRDDDRLSVVLQEIRQESQHLERDKNISTIRDVTDEDYNPTGNVADKNIAAEKGSSTDEKE